MSPTTEAKIAVSKVAGQGAAGKQSMEIIRKLLSNVANNPLEAKYKVINLKNNTIERTITKVPGAIDVLVAAGFMKDGSSCFLLNDSSLEPLQAVLSVVNDMLSNSGYLPKEIDPRNRTDRAAIEKHQSLVATIKNIISLVQSYESKELQDLAKRCIPTFKLAQKAALAVNEGTDLRDELLRQLLLWFKNDFFTWVNSPPCEFCQGPTTNIGGGVPTPLEQSEGAGRVEIFNCTLCNTITRFPRYGRPMKLLETRRGRCGEWANCFTLLCRSLGYNTRYVWDETDHVWTEVWSNKHQRWLHCDSCEAALDKPLIYETGWNKKLSYIIAFSVDEVVDVTRRYTMNLAALRPRRPMPDYWFKEMIDYFDQRQRETMNSEQRAVVEERKKGEEEELSILRVGPSEDETVGRESGSVEWRESRHEIGNQDPEQYPLLFEGDPAPALPLACNHATLVVDTNISSDRLYAVGDATIVGVTGGMILTPERNMMKGAVWALDKVPITHGFISEFGMRMVGKEADGMAFVVQNYKPDALGGEGGQLGYGGMANCLAVEFDTYKGGDCDDPSDNHIGVLTNGSGVLTANHQYSLGHTSNIPKLNEYRIYRVRILYDPSTTSLTIDMKYADVDGIEAPYRRVLAVSVCFAKIIKGSTLWLGFTAATGGCCQRHEVLDWTLKTFIPTAPTTTQ